MTTDNSTFEAKNFAQIECNLLQTINFITKGVATTMREAAYALNDYTHGRHGVDSSLQIPRRKIDAFLNHSDKGRSQYTYGNLDKTMGRGATAEMYRVFANSETTANANEGPQVAPYYPNNQQNTETGIFFTFSTFVVLFLHLLPEYYEGHVKQRVPSSWRMVLISNRPNGGGNQVSTSMTWGWGTKRYTGDHEIMWQSIHIPLPLQKEGSWYILELDRMGFPQRVFTICGVWFFESHSWDYVVAHPEKYSCQAVGLGWNLQRRIGCTTVGIRGTHVDVTLLLTSVTIKTIFRHLFTAIGVIAPIVEGDGDGVTRTVYQSNINHRMVCVEVDGVDRLRGVYDNCVFYLFRLFGQIIGIASVNPTVNIPTLIGKIQYFNGISSALPPLLSRGISAEEGSEVAVELDVARLPR
jgi:hypothetical protein